MNQGSQRNPESEKIDASVVQHIAEDLPSILSQKLIGAVEAALTIPDIVDLPSAVQDLHPADCAELIKMLAPNLRIPLVHRLGSDFNAEILTWIDDVRLQAEILAALEPEAIRAVFASLASDDAVQIVAHLEGPSQRRILAVTAPLQRTQLEEGLTWPEDSAGRMMQREFVLIPLFWNVGQTIDYLRAGGSSARTYHHVFLCDIQYRPVGAVPLSRLLRSKRPDAMRSIMDANPLTIPAQLDREEVGRTFRRYGLVETPVVDHEGKMLGTITVDDVVDVIEEEAEEDMMALCGLVGDDSPSLDTTTHRVALSRLPWLGFNLIASGFVALIVISFEATLAQLVVLAGFIPVVAGIGGNAATQTMTVTVRALATHSLESHGGLGWAVFRELRICAINGSVLACCAGIVGSYITTTTLGIVLGIAIMGNLIVAALGGVVVPNLCLAHED